MPGDPVARKLKAADVIDVLSDLFILRGVPGHIRSDNGPEFIAKSVQAWITGVGARTASIAPGSPWENGYVESFNEQLRDELLNGEIIYTLKEAQIVIESWRRHDNRRASARPPSAIGRQPRRYSCLPRPLGRLRSPDRLRRPSCPWSRDRPCTNFELGPPHGGRSVPFCLLLQVDAQLILALKRAVRQAGRGMNVR